MHNIILFGETGAGKSSVVNMLAGEGMAEISSGGLGCTLRSTAYEFNHEGRKYRIHDTAGLNEGEAGRVPTNDAIFRLCKLLYGLSDGVSLLVFVMRGPRIKENVKHNWTLFYDVICRKKVPILLVVTGLEKEEDMDAWCEREDNWDAFRQHGIHFSAMGGITGCRGKRRSNGTYVYQDEYDESVTKMKRLVRKYHLLTPWKVERVKWFREIYQTEYQTRCFKTTSHQVFVGIGREEATTRLISDCGMSGDDAEKLARDLEKIT